MPRYRKKLRRYARPPQYIGGGKLGQIIGTGVGAVGGSFLGNPMLGAKLGGMAGGAIGGAIDGEQQVLAGRGRRVPVNRTGASYGYRYGGDYAFGGKITTDNQADMLTLQDGGRVSGPEPVPADTTRRRIPRRTTREQQERNYRRDMALKERLRRMKAGDYSMVGDPLEVDTVQVEGREYAMGGQIPGVTPMKGGAKKYNGPKHEQGGVPVDNQGNPTSPQTATAEVEGGETEQDGYIFSDTLTVPKTEGKTFAEVHEMMLKRGASKQDIQKLAMLQEKVQDQEGVQGGDEQQPQTMGEQAQQAQKVANRGATGKNAGQPVGMRRGQPMMRGGGKMKHYQNGGWTNGNPADWEAGEGAIEADVDPVLDSGNQGSFGSDNWLKTAADVAGYAVPSIMKGTMALTDPGVKDTPRMSAEEVSTTSPAFNEGRRALSRNYEAILGDPNATTTQKLAAQSQYLQGRSSLAGKEAQYRGSREQFNAQQRSRAQRTNMQAFQQDREIKAKEDAARKQMLMSAVTDPINALRKNQAGKRSQIANIVMSANQINDPTGRRNAIRRGLKLMGLDEQRIQEIIAKNEAQ